MAKKRYKFPVTIGVHDPSKDVPEVTDTFGRIITHGSKGLRHVPPGEEVEVEPEEAERIYRLNGSYEDWLARQKGVAAVQELMDRGYNPSSIPRRPPPAYSNEGS